MVFSAQVFLIAPNPPENTEKVKSKADIVLPLPATCAMYSNLHDLHLSPTSFLGKEHQLKQKIQ